MQSVKLLCSLCPAEACWLSVSSKLEGTLQAVCQYGLRECPSPRTPHLRALLKIHCIRDRTPTALYLSKHSPSKHMPQEHPPVSLRLRECPTTPHDPCLREHPQGSISKRTLPKVASTLCHYVTTSKETFPRDITSKGPLPKDLMSEEHPSRIPRFYTLWSPYAIL